MVFVCRRATGRSALCPGVTPAGVQREVDEDFGEPGGAGVGSFTGSAQAGLAQDPDQRPRRGVEMLGREIVVEVGILPLHDLDLLGRSGAGVEHHPGQELREYLIDQLQRHRPIMPPRLRPRINRPAGLRGIRAPTGSHEYLPHGRTQAGDRHLRFHELPYNLEV